METAEEMLARIPRVGVPHSLGKLIEWKLKFKDFIQLSVTEFPTRWGN